MNQSNSQWKDLVRQYNIWYPEYKALFEELAAFVEDGRRNHEKEKKFFDMYQQLSAMKEEIMDKRNRDDQPQLPAASTASATTEVSVAPRVPATGHRLSEEEPLEDMNFEVRPGIFECPKCNKSFRGKEGQRSCSYHIRGIHNHEFDCDECKFSFSRRSNFHAHLYRRHTQGFLKCRLCQLGFQGKSRLTAHNNSSRHKKKAAKAARLWQSVSTAPPQTS